MLCFFFILTMVFFVVILDLLMPRNSEHTEVKLLREIRDIVAAILELLEPTLATGRIILVPKTIQVGQVDNATLASLDQNGAPFTLDATYQAVYSASNPASVSFGTPNPDGSVAITAVAPDTVSIGCVVTRPDGVAITYTPDTLTIVPVPPPTPVLTSGSVVL